MAEKKTLGQAIDQILDALQGLDENTRLTALTAVQKHLGIEAETSFGGFFGGLRSSQPSAKRHTTPLENEPSEIVNEANSLSFSEDRSMSPKEFLLEKSPRTDVERVACLAYYLTHFRGIPHFKTTDLSMLNTEAAQVKFSNASTSAKNALAQGYLASATKGNRQISAAGELYVQALPDRDAARKALASAKPKRKYTKVTKKNKASTTKPKKS